MNTQDKERFIMQYYGQNVLVVINNDGSFEQTQILGKVWPFNEEDHLLLTPLDRITDEDTIGLAKACGVCISERVSVQFSTTGYYGYWTLVDGKRNGFTMWDHITLQGYDYLRSKGYAIDWNGYTVKEMESAGWLKLKEV